ncbi:SUKH superfamily protein [Lachnotalea glycerini]|uniref:SUKH superfamily protein n=1 Tax=Lachnotalea glycerini TaxID=1763509 RepID=A0A318EKK1_9FIRM|nr:SMI1/KNR4 family protein [Lachnotalea glycerini]PXV84497.1 SUKH superfamily protein [Lachnotalea glycerini]
MINLQNISGISKSKPASNDEISIVENRMNILLPEYYKELLNLTNGFSTDRGLVIYGTEDIYERNEILEVEKYANGYVAIGDDSGDMVFLISKDNRNEEVLSVGCGDMNTQNAKHLAPNLLIWLNNNCNLETSGENNTQTQYYNIILTGVPKGGLKDLVKIKNVLNINMSSAELLKASKNLPYTIISNVSYGKAINYFEKLTEFSGMLKLERLKSN